MNERTHILCRNASKSHRSAQGDTLALRDVALHIAAQEFVCIVGPSGCGKTTLLKLIAGLQRPDSGAIEIAGDAVGAVDSTSPNCAMVFQDQGVFPWLTVLENAALGLEMQGVARAERHARAEKWLRSAGLGEFLRSYPHQLSGGMRQRVAIARAFLSDAPILLMDEPFSALDAQIRLRMQEELLNLWQGTGRTVVYVTHDVEEAVWLGDRVLVMSDRPGRIAAEFAIPLGRPRLPIHRMSKSQQDVLADCRWRIWECLAAFSATGA